MADKLDRKAYQHTLPKKRVSAGCLLFDEAGRLLIVNPIYKRDWEIPGGVVEANESPFNACIREIREELGIDWRPQRLLNVDYIEESADRTESLAFIFYGGVMSAQTTAAIRLPENELSEFRLLPPDEALYLLNPRLRKRVANCFQAMVNGTIAYLEEAKPI